MSFAKEKETLMRHNPPAAPPSTSQTPYRSDAALLKDELSKAADSIKWPRMPELREFEQMAHPAIAAGHYGLEERMDSSASGRARLLNSIGRTTWMGAINAQDARCGRSAGRRRD